MNKLSGDCFDTLSFCHICIHLTIECSSMIVRLVIILCLVSRILALVIEMLRMGNRNLQSLHRHLLVQMICYSRGETPQAYHLVNRLLHCRRNLIVLFVFLESILVFLLNIPVFLERTIVLCNRMLLDQSLCFCICVLWRVLFLLLIRGCLLIFDLSREILLYDLL